MKKLEIVRQWMAEGLILHPLERSPNSVDLIRTLATLCGYKEFKETHWVKSLKRDLLAGYRANRPPQHYLFVLVDGLGANLAPHFPEGGFFETYFTRELRAVFPSTTACAFTSLVTGEWPGTHGLTGWHTYLPEFERTILPLPFVERTTDTPLEKLGIEIGSVLTLESLFPRIGRKTFTYLPSPLKKSTYSQWAHGTDSAVGYRSIGTGLSAAAELLRRETEPTFVFFYIPDLDSAQHEWGTNGVRVRRLVRSLDAALLSLRESIEDEVRLVVSADHGLVDVPKERQFRFADHDPLLKYLTTVPSGEAAMPVFHVREGFERKFEEFFASSYGTFMQLLSVADAEALGLFGADGISATMRARLGTYIGIAPEPVALIYDAPGRKPLDHLAFHGGLQPAVMNVPLFLG